MITTKALVLQTIRYQESGIIVKCYTQKMGLVSFFVKSAFGKSKKNFISYFQPLTLINISFVERKNTELHYFKSLELVAPYYTLHVNYYKSTVVLFISELLSLLMREEPPNTDLFSFLEHSLLWFDKVDKSPDFHLFLLVNYIKFSGILPSIETINQPYLNIPLGIFVENYIPSECFTLEESNLFKKALQLNLEKPSALNGKERRKILDLILKFYSELTETFHTPKTLEVIYEMYQ